MKMRRHSRPAKSRSSPAAAAQAVLSLHPLPPPLASFPGAPRCWQLPSTTQAPFLQETGQGKVGQAGFKALLQACCADIHTQAGRFRANGEMWRRGIMLHHIYLPSFWPREQEYTWKSESWWFCSIHVAKVLQRSCGQSSDTLGSVICAASQVGVCKNSCPKKQRLAPLSLLGPAVLTVGRRR